MARKLPRGRILVGKIIRFSVIGVAVAVVMYPILTMVTWSLLPTRGILSTFSGGGAEWTFDNYVRVIQYGTGEQGFTDVRRFFINSVIYSVSTTAITVLLASFGGYALARLRFPGRGFLGRLVLFKYMLPGILLAIPLFVLLYRFGLVDTYLAVILAYLTMTLPFCLWLLRSFFLSLPIHLEDAARVDGCTQTGAFLRVALPLAKPGIATAAMFAFLLSWNEFLFGLLLVRSESMKPLAPGLMSAFGYHAIDTYGEMMASAVIVFLPVFFIFLWLQKYLVSGMTAGAVKG